MLDAAARHTAHCRSSTCTGQASAHMITANLSIMGESSNVRPCILLAFPIGQ